MAGCSRGAAPDLHPAQLWKLQKLRGGDDCRLSTFPKYFNALTYSFKLAGWVSLWGKLRFLFGCFPRWIPLLILPYQPVRGTSGANLWPAESRSESAGFDPRFRLFPTPQGCERQAPGAVGAAGAEEIKGPPSALIWGGHRRREHEGKRVL